MLNYQTFCKNAEEKNWLKLQDYPVVKNSRELVQKMELWIDDKEEMYILEIWENNMALMFKYLGEFEFA